MVEKYSLLGSEGEDNTRIEDCAKICGKTKVCENAEVGGFVELKGDAVVSETIFTMEGEPQSELVTGPKQELKSKVRKTVQECQKILPRFLVSVSVTAVFVVIVAIIAFSTESSIVTAVLSILSALLATVGFISSIMYGVDFYTHEDDLLYLTREEKPTLYNVDNFCIELKELGEQMQNEELRGVIAELLQVLTENKEWAEDLHEGYLSETIELLRKYLALGKERPDGYEDLIRYLQSF